MANLELVLNKEALDEALYVEKESLEDYFGKEIDDELYARLLAASLDVTEHEMDAYDGNIYPEYCNLREAWSNFRREVVFHAACKLLRG